MRAALHLWKKHDYKDKWVVLGDMLELGENEKQYHENLADEMMAMDLKVILLYGPRMEWLYDV